MYINWALGVTCDSFLHRQPRSLIDHNPSIFTVHSRFHWPPPKKRDFFKIHSIENRKSLTRLRRKKKLGPNKDRGLCIGLTMTWDCRNGIRRISIETKNYAHTQKIGALSWVSSIKLTENR